MTKAKDTAQDKVPDYAPIPGSALGPRGKPQQKGLESLSGTNLERAGDHNQRVTLQAVRAHGPITRSELAGITGLTAPAIANITKRLINEGMILKAGRLLGGRGQPATKLVINPDGAYSIGINIDRDHVTLVALDFKGDVRAHAISEMAFAGPAEVDAFLGRELEKIFASKAVQRERLIGVGIGIPDDLGRIIRPYQPDSYKIWSQTDITTLLAKHLNVPVFVENDAAAAAIGEMQFGHGLQVKSFVYLLISVGLGGGLVINGQYFRGATGRSGEIGYLPLSHPTDPSLNDPAKTLGDVVTISSLYEALQAKGYRVAQPDDLADLDEGGQATVEAWIARTADYLYSPLLTLSCAIDPEAIFIGGRLPASIIERLCQAISQRLSALRDSIPNLTPVHRAALAVDASAIGAAILPFNDRFLPTREALMKTA